MWCNNPKYRIIFSIAYLGPAGLLSSRCPGRDPQRSCRRSNSPERRQGCSPETLQGCSPEKPQGCSPESTEGWLKNIFFYVPLKSEIGCRRNCLNFRAEPFEKVKKNIFPRAILAKVKNIFPQKYEKEAYLREAGIVSLSVGELWVGGVDRLREGHSWGSSATTVGAPAATRLHTKLWFAKNSMHPDPSNNKQIK